MKYNLLVFGYAVALCIGIAARTSSSASPSGTQNSRQYRDQKELSEGNVRNVVIDKKISTIHEIFAKFGTRLPFNHTLNNKISPQDYPSGWMYFNIWDAYDCGYGMITQQVGMKTDTCISDGISNSYQYYCDPGNGDHMLILSFTMSGCLFDTLQNITVAGYCSQVPYLDTFCSQRGSTLNSIIGCYLYSNPLELKFTTDTSIPLNDGINEYVIER
jgi:hypothetical protein